MNKKLEKLTKLINATAYCFAMVLITVVSSISFGQSITWQRFYDGRDHVSDAGFDICKADGDNIYVCGYTTVLPNVKHIYLMKLNANGDTIWTRTLNLGTNTSKIANAIAASGDGGCVITGDGQFAFSLKFNSTGDIVWNKNYGGSFKQCFTIIKTFDGGYIACGRDAEGLNQGAYILKIDLLGNLQWQKTYYAGYWKLFYSVAETHSNDGYLLSGFKFNSSQDTSRSIVFRINSAGDSLWEKEYDRSIIWSINTIKKMGSNYLIGGNNFTAQNQRKNFIAKINENGDTTFFKTIESTNLNEYFGEIEVINPNRYVIAASRDSILNYNAHVVIVDSTGNVLADRIYQSEDFIDLKTVLPLPNGDIVFTGQVDFNSVNTREDIYVLRTDSLLNAPPPIGIVQLNNHLPEAFKLHQNYPNPFNPQTTIDFDLSIEAIVKMNLFDVTGKLLLNLINYKMSTGKHKYFLDAEKLNLASGIFFIKLEISNNYFQSIKILYIK